MVLIYRASQDKDLNDLIKQAEYFKQILKEMIKDHGVIGAKQFFDDAIEEIKEE